ncbi:MAG: hypothetical protein WC495_07245 [Patescibacteria group bacterium]|jgi:hypothetical protein
MIKLKEIRRKDIEYSTSKKGDVITVDITGNPDERKARILTNKWQKLETSMRILKKHLDETKSEIRNTIKDIVDAADLLNTVKFEAEKFIVTMDKQVNLTKENKDKYYAYLAKALNMSEEAVQALEKSLTERVETGSIKEPTLRYTPKMESVFSTIKSAFYNLFVKKYINPIKDILSMVASVAEEENIYNNLTSEDIQKYGTEKEQEFLNEYIK